MEQKKYKCTGCVVVAEGLDTTARVLTDVVAFLDGKMSRVQVSELLSQLHKVTGGPRKKPDLGMLAFRAAILDALGSEQHEVWSSWMRYLFGKCDEEHTVTDGGDCVPAGRSLIPKWAVERWTRQMNTPYVALSKKEQQSDVEVVAEHCATTRALLDVAMAAATVLDSLATQLPLLNDKTRGEVGLLREATEELALMVSAIHDHTSPQKEPGVESNKDESASS